MKLTLAACVAALLLWGVSDAAHASQCKKTITKGCPAGKKRSCTAPKRRALQLKNPNRYKNAWKQYRACMIKAKKNAGKGKQACINKMRSIAKSLIGSSSRSYCGRKWKCGPCR